jgi:hypothetical protein
VLKGQSDAVTMSECLEVALADSKRLSPIFIDASYLTNDVRNSNHQKISALSERDNARQSIVCVLFICHHLYDKRVKNAMENVEGGEKDN